MEVGDENTWFTECLRLVDVSNLSAVVICFQISIFVLLETAEYKEYTNIQSITSIFRKRKKCVSNHKSRLKRRDL